LLLPIFDEGIQARFPSRGINLILSQTSYTLDEFLALEQKVLQTVELIKTERSARAEAQAERDAAQAEAAELRQKLTAADEKLAAVNEKLTAVNERLTAADQKLTAAADAQAEIAALQSERTAVRQRVEKMLATMDSLL